MKDHKSGILIVANAIRKLFETPYPLSEETLHLLESTYGISQPEELSEMLAPPFNCEAESLCDMIFFPDEHQQIRLEPVLEKHPITNDREKTALMERVAATPVKLIVTFPADNRRCKIDIPETVTRRFINRLRTDRHVDARITRSIHDNIKAPGTSALLKVKLRNTHFAFEENKVLSLCDFFDRISEETAEFMDLFMLFCRILETMDTDADLYTELLNQKRIAADILRLAEKNEKELQHQPVEALMMKGISIAAVNVEEVRRQVEHIDQITLGLFGKTGNTPAMAQTSVPMELGVFKKNENGINCVIKILS